MKYAFGLFSLQNMAEARNLGSPQSYQVAVTNGERQRCYIVLGNHIHMRFHVGNFAHSVFNASIKCQIQVIPWDIVRYAQVECRMHHLNCLRIISVKANEREARLAKCKEAKQPSYRRDGNPTKLQKHLQRYLDDGWVPRRRQPENRTNGS